MVYHGIHTPGGDTEEQARLAQLFEIAQVVTPVRLRHDGNLETFGLQHPTNYGSAKSRMIYVGIAREENHIQLVPASHFHLFFGGWQPCSIIDHTEKLFLQK